MKRLLGSVASFFFPWGWAKCLLGLVLLIALLYLEEDWRGAHAWNAAESKWEAQGGTLDYSKLIPPPVPDERNLAALPFFRIGQIDNGSGPYSTLIELRKATHSDEDHPPDLPKFGNWQRGELANRGDMRKTIAADYASVFKGQAPPANTLAQFNDLFPFTEILCSQVATRSEYRLNLDYDLKPPLFREFGPLTEGIKLAHFLTANALLALDQGRSDEAAKDIQVNFIVARGTMRDPTLVGGLVGIGVVAINDSAIYQGLAWHQWSDAQLVEIEKTAPTLDFLHGFEFAMRSEAVFVVSSWEFLQHGGSEATKKLGLNWGSSSARYWPAGWWDQNKRGHLVARADAMQTVDPQRQEVFPRKADDLLNQIDRDSKSWLALAPWNCFFAPSAGLLSRSIAHYAEAQVWLDEMRIACALERYRLAHGEYPARLEMLAPADIDVVPHDIMNGNPYHYRVRPDGTFVLYSVGWNQTDNGGTEADESGTTRRDYTQGDWVWPTPRFGK